MARNFLGKNNCGWKHDFSEVVIYDLHDADFEELELGNLSTNKHRDKSRILRKKHMFPSFSPKSVVKKIIKSRIVVLVFLFGGLSNIL